VASQEFLASFAVEIDEAGVARLQEILSANKEMAEGLAGAFSAASSAIHTFMEELGTLPGFSTGGIVTEGMSGLGGLTLGLDTAAAEKDLQSFIALAKKPVPLSANASGMVSAARSAYSTIQGIFSTPITVRANVETGTGGDGDGGSVPKMSAGGRFSKPTHIEVAEDGDAEYIIPIKKEDRAVPLLRQLLGDLSPAAREQLGSSGFGMQGAMLGGGLTAGSAGTGNISMDNRMVSAPVNIQVHASGTSAERIGQSLYDTAERYLLRTLKGAMA
jgi:hypothetical protein